MIRNAVLARELDLMLRNWRAPVAIAALVACTGGIALLYLGTAAAGQANRGLPLDAGAHLFGLLTTVQLSLIILIAPGLTTGSLSGERERRTLEPLWLTGLSAPALVWGKLGAAMAYLLLLLTATSPVLGLLFLLGGIGLRPVLLTYAVIACTGWLLAALGLCASALSRRTQTAAAATYILTAVLVVGTALPPLVAGGALADRGSKPNALAYLASANPITALASTTGGAFFSPILLAGLGPGVRQQAGAARENQAAAGGAGAEASAASAGLTAPVSGREGGSVIQAIPAVTYRYLSVSAVAALLMTAVAAWAVRPPGRPLWRPLARLAGRRRRAVAAAGGGGGDG